MLSDSEKPLEHMIDEMLDMEADCGQVNAQVKEEQPIMSEKKVEIVFKGECTIYEVAEWHNKIIEKWSDQSQDLDLNMADISDVDASFVQLLLSCKKTAHAKGGICHLTQVPPILEERLINMHVAEILSDDS